MSLLMLDSAYNIKQISPSCQLEQPLSSDLNGFENGTEVQHRPVRSWTMYLRRRIKWPLRIPRPSQLYKKLGCPKPLSTASKKA